METKIIVITGGVYSSLGKGIIAASIGRLLKENGFSISMLKLDPYLNVDPGTLSPYQHGEVFVTNDGAETDLDLGHYERFIDTPLSGMSSMTSGKIYLEVIENERKGNYNGNTVQVVPHVTDMIESKIKKIILANKLDFLIIEIGGTIGDIESLPFIEALRIFSAKYGRKNIMFIHASPIIELEANKERKTKPTQHSIKNLRSLGINPNMLVLRSSTEIKKEDMQKLSWTCGIDENMIFVSQDCDYIYDVPPLLFKQGILNSLFDYFEIKKRETSITNWKKFVETIHVKKTSFAYIAIVGKYVKLNDAYLSIIESLKIAAWNIGVELKFELIDASKINDDNYQLKFKNYTGILVPGGFGQRGIEGKILSAKYARENNIPYFGICLGMQMALISFAKDVLNLKNANSIEFDEKTIEPIFIEMKKENKIGGTLRRGAKLFSIKKNSLASKIYSRSEASERHRHRFAFNNDYSAVFEKSGMIISGISNDDNVAEIFELKNHPFYIGVQFHPEFTSRPNNPQAIFKSFVKSSAHKKLETTC